MQIAFNTVFWSSVAVVAGGMVGLAFGKVQDAAWRRHQKLENNGQFKSGWGVMPGSMSRVACLLVALAVVQVFCPMLFNNGCQWWVSGGVVLGYGWTLFRQMKQRLAQYSK